MKHEKHCSLCGQHIPESLIEERKRLKRLRIKAALVSAKAAGRSIGRPIKRNDVAILALRKKGLSMAAIARLQKISSHTVFRSLKKAKKGDT